MKSHSNTKRDSLPYRKGVGIMLLNQTFDKVFVGRRIDQGGIDAWQMPQGGIDEGETPLDAAFRELLEEIGTNNATVISQTKPWLYYDLPEHFTNLWEGRFRGQQQIWFLMKLKGGDDLINIVTEHPEFAEWRWVRPEQIVELIVPFKKDLYTKVLEEFLPLILIPQIK